jgi:Family of unknown function (DUF5715)/Transglycosylase SLT domain
MTELAHDASCLVCRARAEGPRRLAQGLALFAAGLCVTTGILNLRPAQHVKKHVAAAPAAAPITPADAKRGAAAHQVFAANAATARAHAADAAQLDRDAALGVDRNLLLASPGGVMGTAARVAQWRRLVVSATRGSEVDPNLLEAIVFVESSGRADVTGGSAVGLTQLHPSAARRLGLHVDLRRSNKLTHQIYRAWNHAHAKQLRRWRARYDQRYAPARALRATVAYLESARTTLGRGDLAVQAYHVGVPALRDVHVPFAELYVRSSRTDDYYFKVVAAERVMHLWRANRNALRYELAQQVRKNSSEEYIHPLARTHRFSSPNAILRAWGHTLRGVPIDTPHTHIAISGTLGAEARKLGRSRRLYRALRPQALDVLLYIGQRVHELSGGRHSLLLTSAVRDNRYQRVLMHVNSNAARTYSMHTTGYAFDIARAYSSPRQARAFQFVLDRLSAVNAIAYIREAEAIHIAVSSDASRKLKLIEALGG